MVNGANFVYKSRRGARIESERERACVRCERARARERWYTMYVKHWFRTTGYKIDFANEVRGW